jgi:hypothetical protein
VLDSVRPLTSVGSAGNKVSYTLGAMRQPHEKRVDGSGRTLRKTMTATIDALNRVQQGGGGAVESRDTRIADSIA